MNASWAQELLGTAEEAATYMRGADAAQWRIQLEDDAEACDQALYWFLAEGHDDEALRMCRALVDFWQYTDRMTLGRQWYERVMSARATADRARAEAGFDAGLLAFFQGDDEAAVALFTDALELARRLDAPAEAALALTGLARLALRDDVARGESLATEALETLEGVDDIRCWSNTTHLLGVAAQMGGRYLEAREWMRKRLDYAHQMDDLRGAAGEAANLSSVELALGNTARARELAEQALRSAVQLGDAWMVPYVVNALAAIAVSEEEHERAAVLLAAAEQIVERQGATWPPDEAEHFAKSQAAVSAALSQDELDRARSTGRAMSTEQVVAFAL